MTTKQEKQGVTPEAAPTQGPVRATPTTPSRPPAAQPDPLPAQKTTNDVYGPSPTIGHPPSITESEAQDHWNPPPPPVGETPEARDARLKAAKQRKLDHVYLVRDIPQTTNGPTAILVRKGDVKDYLSMGWRRAHKDEV